jgi:CRP/FNR family transcriptional regulator
MDLKRVTFSGRPSRECLKGTGFCAGLSEEDVQRVCSCCALKRYKRGTFIYLADDEGDPVLFLKAGRVKVFRLSEEGKEKIISIFKKGDMFGEVALFSSNGAGQTMAQVLEEAEMCRFDKRDLEEIIMDCPQVAIKVIQSLSRKLLRATRQIECLSLMNVHERIKCMLGELAEEQGLVTARGVELRLTHREIGCLVSANRVTVTKAIHNLEREGFLRVLNRRIIIISISQAYALQGKRMETLPLEVHCHNPSIGCMEGFLNFLQKNGIIKNGLSYQFYVGEFL